MVQGKQSFVPDPVGHAEVLRFGAPMDPRSVVDQIVRDGARQMLQALEDEVNALLEPHASKTDQNGRRQVVRNGYVQSSRRRTRTGTVPNEGNETNRREEPSYASHLAQCLSWICCYQQEPCYARHPAQRLTWF